MRDKKRLGLKTVLALCFAEYHETSYHWQIYSGDINGVCIVFNKHALMNQIGNVQGIKSGIVKYKLLDELKDVPFERLPFTKRYGFSEEREFRILYIDREKSYSRKDIQIDLGCIDRVMFNPWIPQHIYKSIRETIKEMNGMQELKILKSTLTNNKTWKRWGSEISNLHQPDFHN